jgi:hypothetical protein
MQVTAGSDIDCVKYVEDALDMIAKLDNVPVGNILIINSTRFVEF